MLLLPDASELIIHEPHKEFWPFVTRVYSEFYGGSSWKWGPIIWKKRQNFRLEEIATEWTISPSKHPKCILIIGGGNDGRLQGGAFVDRVHRLQTKGGVMLSGFEEISEFLLR